MGHRCTNIYDLNEKTYLFKFAIVGQPEKINILIESGVRFHTTKYVRDKADMPSSFTMKLRKHLRTKRLESIQQFGMDRVIVLRFGSGDGINYLIVELYANGNIILTNSDYIVLVVLRTHQFDADVVLKVGEPYPLKFATTSVKAAQEIEEKEDEHVDEKETNELKDSQEEVVKVNSHVKVHESVLSMEPSQFVDWARGRENEHIEWHKGPQNDKGKKKAKKMYLKQLLLQKDSGVSDLGPEILDHSIIQAGLPGSSKVDSLYSLDQSIILSLLEQLRLGQTFLSSLSSISDNKGYLLTELEGDTDYVEFTSVLLKQHENRSPVLYNAFSEAVDEFFRKLEDSRLTKQAVSIEIAAKQKIEKVREARKAQVNALAEKQKTMELSASLVEFHASNIDKVSLVLNSAVSSGMSWEDIEEMVLGETEAGNPIASLVKGFNLGENCVTVRLSDVYAEDDEDDEEGEKYCDVEINLGLTAHANARNMFTDKKIAAVKEEKTVYASSMHVASVEESVLKQLEKQNMKRNLQSVRKVHWFEKFNWFISTEGYLVISGRDAGQNEQIVKKYLRPEDLYLHADIHGASSCVLRHKGDSSDTTKGASSISPYAIQEAGNFCVCRSSAWSSKAMTSAWWVFGSQVSKSAPTGEYLKTGSFMIYGKKNFLPPMPFELGFGIMFKIDDDSISRHINDRKNKLLTDDMESVMSEAAERYNLSEGGDESSYSNTFAQKDPSASESAESKKNDILGSNSKKEAEKMTEVNSKNKKNVPQPQKQPVSTKIKDQNQGEKTKKKKIDKKKARRYAEQDDDDRQLAMQALGHGKVGEKLKDKIQQLDKDKAEEHKLKKLDSVGILDFQKEAEINSTANLTDTVKNAIALLVDGSVLENAGEIARDEMLALTELSDDGALEVIEMFKEGLAKQEKITGNKSGFLSGIIRRYKQQQQKIKQAASAAASNTANTVIDESESVVKMGAETRETQNTEVGVSMPSAEQNDLEEVRVILEEEGLLEEDELANVDELIKLVGFPHEDDVIMYAIPFCGPYSSMKDFKYRVKLTPGSMKKGKIAKTAIEAFTRNSFVSDREKLLMKSLTDPEMVAILVGESKLSMPGLTQVRAAAKKDNKKKQRGQGGGNN